jgi:prophage antirepressor-like protein
MTNNVKIEEWNGHPLRFVEKDGEWLAVAADVCKALDIENTSQALAAMPDPYICQAYIGVDTGKKRDGSPAKQQVKVLILSELGVYRLIMRSNKPEAEAFQDWVFNLLKALREAAGYEQWQMMMFTESVQNHHLNMSLLKEAFNPQDKYVYPKAHSITNKCIANIIGEPKAVKKEELKKRFPEMIPLRDRILGDTVQLMTTQARFGLSLSVSGTINSKYVKEAVK